jgi:hypothetical protein
MKALLLIGALCSGILGADGGHVETRSFVTVADLNPIIEYFPASIAVSGLGGAEDIKVADSGIQKYFCLSGYKCVMVGASNAELGTNKFYPWSNDGRTLALHGVPINCEVGRVSFGKWPDRDFAANTGTERWSSSGIFPIRHEDKAAIEKLPVHRDVVSRVGVNFIGTKPCSVMPKRGPCGIGSASCFGGAGPGCFQGEPYKDNAESSNEHFPERHAEHALGPFRHIQLGLIIASEILLFFLGGLFLVCGVQRASDALYVVLDGNRNDWWRFGFWFGVAMSGAGVSSGIVTYALSVCADC